MSDFDCILSCSGMDVPGFECIMQRRNMGCRSKFGITNMYILIDPMDMDNIERERDLRSSSEEFQHTLDSDRRMGWQGRRRAKEENYKSVESQKGRKSFKKKGEFNWVK